MLWFFAGWCAWALIASVADVTPLFGPVLGASFAGVVAGDPMHRIWTPRVATDRIRSRLEAIHTSA